MYAFFIKDEQPEKKNWQQRCIQWKVLKTKIKFYNGKSMKIIIILIKNPNKKFIILIYQKKAFNIFV